MNKSAEKFYGSSKIFIYTAPGIRYFSVALVIELTLTGLNLTLSLNLNPDSSDCNNMRINQ